ncbi:glycosyltransferase family 4 protein [Rhizoctonia solani AG-3 Rhs1AP]|uniref:Glycosyltransferase family 4 protein n=2 Tax=Rhizoctonia solani AG-3 TaxID=1086053 RepID=A0A074RV78_9AGAM|nr:glycosyltransferase family 4 protein [Rhizoctonia solani AG-3 Rhs1AP]KEP51031.1 glycosyltransferase family 4 protein [Rhizoctonia solani 123E]
MGFKIAMICDFFHPNIGGVENHIYMLSVHLQRLGHKVIIITHSHPPNRHGIRWLNPGIKVYHVPFVTLTASATLPNFLTFLPYFRTIMIRERVQIVHGHASLSSLAHEGLLHAHHLDIRTVFTDHSLFSLDDATGILTNKLLAGVLKSVDAIIGVSHTGRENTMLRANAVAEVLQNPTDTRFFVVPNAISPEQFQPGPVTQRDLTKQITIVVISRLAYRKGVDLLVAAAPRVCAQFPQVHFVIGGDGPKLTNLLQMRERHMLQDRIHLLGSLRHNQVHETLLKGDIYLNTSLTESFGIGLLEAACTGLYVVSTRVGGVPEVLPQDMISFALPEEDDVTRALGEAIDIVTQGKHDPQKAHKRIKSMYSWADVAERTEEIYNWVATKEPRSFWERLCRTYNLGVFAGPIYVIILVVDCFFFAFLEWWLPRDQLDILGDQDEWNEPRFVRMTQDRHE